MFRFFSKHFRLIVLLLLTAGCSWAADITLVNPFAEDLPVKEAAIENQRPPTLQKSGAHVVPVSDHRLPSSSDATVPLTPHIASELEFWTDLLQSCIVEEGSGAALAYASVRTREWLDLIRQTGDPQYESLIVRAESMLIAAVALLGSPIVPGSIPPDAEPSPPGHPSPEAQAALNNVLYGLNRLDERLAARQSSWKLLESYYWTEARLRQLKEVPQIDPASVAEADSRLKALQRIIADHLIVEMAQALTEAEARISRRSDLDRNTAAFAGIESRLLHLRKLVGGDADTISPLQERLQKARAASAKATAGPFEISGQGQRQMKDLVAWARSHHRGGSFGDCFNAVWGYMTSSGYGNLKAWGDLPAMPSGEARHFSEYLNASPARLEEAGLQRIDQILTPKIVNPHDSRIPDGAVIVVAAGSYGTRHLTAGDIAVKAGAGQFINDGPNMDYGTPSSWYGQILGVYVPK